MTQSQRLDFLINYLVEEDENLKKILIPSDEISKQQLFRSLMNIRSPKPISSEFLEIQDAYLQEKTKEKGVVSLKDLKPIQPGIYLWQGDITRLSVDAITNAANSALLGCFIPCHNCIDNAIHSSAGIELREECANLMAKQNIEEPVGKAKITKAYNLPAHYVIHTVGPYIAGPLTAKDRELLASCYRSCLELASSKHLNSIALCCISTGEFHFPNDEAAKIAVDTVREFKEANQSDLNIIFNVFKDKDYEIYRQLLEEN